MLQYCYVYVLDKPLATVKVMPTETYPLYGIHRFTYIIAPVVFMIAVYNLQLHAN